MKSRVQKGQDKPVRLLKALVFLMFAMFAMTTDSVGTVIPEVGRRLIRACWQGCQAVFAVVRT